MKRLKELRMSLIIIVIGVFFLSGCIFQSKHTVTYKTNGGTTIANSTVKKGNRLNEPEEPTKEGYVFDGWYLEGEKFDFKSEIDDDITLVAKWKKIEVVTEEGSSDDEDTTKTTKSTTNKVESNAVNTSTTKKKTTTSVKTTSKKKTTKKTTKKSTTTSTTTTTTTTTQAINNVPIIQPILPPVNKPVVTGMNIVKQEVKDGDIVKEEKIIITFDVESDKENVRNNVENITLKELLNSDKTNLEIYNNNSTVYEFTNTMTFENNTITLSGDKDVDTLIINNNGTIVAIEYDEVNDDWVIRYPTVVVTDSSSLYKKYYTKLKDAFKNAEEGNTITLRANHELNEAVKIYKPVIINGDGYMILSEKPYAFDLSEFNYPDKDLYVDNITFKCKTVFDVSKDRINKIKLSNTVYTSDVLGQKVEITSDITILERETNVNIIPDNTPKDGEDDLGYSPLLPTFNQTL